MSTITTPAPVAAPKFVTLPNGQSVQALDAERTMQIINSRITVKPTDVGGAILLQVQGQGTFLRAGHEYTVAGDARSNQFDRYLYNVKASSAMAMASAEGKRLLTDGMKAESTGDIQAAHDNFNAYLNFIQLSFSVIERPNAIRLHSGDDVKASVVEVVSKAGNKSLQLENVSYQAPKVVAKTKFSISELIEA